MGTEEGLKICPDQRKETCLDRVSLTESWNRRTLGEKNYKIWGTCVAQSAKHLTLGFGSGYDLRVLGSSLHQAPHSAWSLLETLSPSLSNKIFKNKTNEISNY